jgi:hypothetical protein
MDDYLPSRTWIPPISSSPDSYSSSSSPTLPQPEHWKSPPYKNRHELKRDNTCYQLFASTNAQPTSTTTTTTTTTTTSPIMHQNSLESPTNKSSYFQYTSKAYHTQQMSSRRRSSTSHNSNASNRVESDIEEVNYLLASDYR